MSKSKSATQSVIEPPTASVVGTSASTERGESDDVTRDLRARVTLAEAALADAHSAITEKQQQIADARTAQQERAARLADLSAQAQAAVTQQMQSLTSAASSGASDDEDAADAQAWRITRQQERGEAVIAGLEAELTPLYAAVNVAATHAADAQRVLNDHQWAVEAEALRQRWETLTSEAEALARDTRAHNAAVGGPRGEQRRSHERLLVLPGQQTDAIKAANADQQRINRVGVRIGVSDDLTQAHIAEHLLHQQAANHWW